MKKLKTKNKKLIKQKTNQMTQNHKFKNYKTKLKIQVNIKI